MTHSKTEKLSHSQILAETNRLYLRALQSKDAEALFTYRNQPEVSLFQGWTPENPQEVSDYAVEMQSREPCAAGHWYQVVIVLKETTGKTNSETVIGDVAFCIETEHKQQAELGIALGTQFQGQGYALEAIHGLVDFLFRQFALHRIHVSIDPANSPSRKLFKRAGFRLEGHLLQAVYFKGQWCDDIIMAILRHEWQHKANKPPLSEDC